MITKNAVPSTVCERPLVSLVSPDPTFYAEMASVLEGQYRLLCMAAEEVLHLPDLRHEAFSGTAAILLGWNAEDPAVLLKLRAIARQQSVPLIALCRSYQADRIAALVLGADYVLTWPFGADLVRAYSLAYRRLQSHQDGHNAGDGASGSSIPEYCVPSSNRRDISRTGALCVDHTARRCKVNNTMLKLTSREFDVLALLVRNPSVCFTRDRMLREVWGLHFDPETNILDVQIYNLRQKLKPYGLAPIIETVRGVGYRLAPLDQAQNL